MTLTEFKALKQGDRVVNYLSGSYGVIESTDERGVTVRWDGSKLTRYYSVVTTMWMHWSFEQLQHCRIEEIPK